MNLSRPSESVDTFCTQMEGQILLAFLLTLEIMRGVLGRQRPHITITLALERKRVAFVLQLYCLKTLCLKVLLE